MLAYGGVKVQSRFYQGDLVTRKGDQKIHSVSRRLTGYPGELACMILCQLFVTHTQSTPPVDSILKENDSIEVKENVQQNFKMLE